MTRRDPSFCYRWPALKRAFSRASRIPRSILCVRDSNMTFSTRSNQAISKQAAMALAAIVVLAHLICQVGTGQQVPPENWTAEQDHQNMMEQLGIKALRPGPRGNETDANHAYYAEP